MLKVLHFGKLNFSNIRQIGRAIIIGIATGLVVSVFRLTIQYALSWVTACFRFFHHQPIWLIPWTIGSIILALILGEMSQKKPNIKG